METSRNGEKRAAAFVRLLERYDQTRVLKAVFYGLLAGVVITLALDYRQLAEMDALAEMSRPGRDPVLPAASPGKGEPLRPDVETSPEALREQLTVTLEPGGVLRLAGTIYPGASEMFAAEIARLGEYAAEVELDSPGGSVEDALAIGRLIRERGLSTAVRQGALCASSCPLVFAGGAQRTADEGASVGVHQIYAAEGAPSSTVQAMASAQATTARIARHLEAMDVDAALWTHAMETPPTRLYYLSREEMDRYRLTSATALAGSGG